MKVRIGFGLGTRTNLNDESYGVLVDELERLDFDSLWLSERISGEAPDPLVAMAYGAGRTSNLKFGMSVMVLPGRNPIVLAKELATLGTMSGGRLLPAFGLGAVDPVEQQAFGVVREQRAAIFDEMLTVMRLAWTGETFSHHGARFDYDGVRVRPAPKRMDVWLGGQAPSELRRVGRLADGWLPSFVLPGDVEAGRVVIETVAAEHDPRDRTRPLRRTDPLRVRPDPRCVTRRPGEAPTRPRRRVRARSIVVGRADRIDQALRRRGHVEVRRPPGGRTEGRRRMGHPSR